MSILMPPKTGFPDCLHLEKTNNLFCQATKTRLLMMHFLNHQSSSLVLSCWWLVACCTQLTVCTLTMSINLEQVDTLHDQNDAEQCYNLLKAAYGKSATNIEVLWRLARACHGLASSLSSKDNRKKDLLLEGQRYAMEANKTNEGKNDFNVLKWCAVCTGGVTDYLGTKEKIQQGYQFKEYLDKALAIKTEYSLYHMRGRFSFSVASLGWVERKLASTFFATPPSATYDDALKDFLKVEELKPNVWIENLIYVAKCYIVKKDFKNASKYLKAATAVEPQDEADKESQEEAKELIKKNCK